MPTVKQSERGFTIIEVALAIVIGIMVVAGATLLYRQASLSAGNVRAQEKTQALGSIVEEFAVRQNRYPTHDQLRALWINHRPDAMLSPWGGSLGTNGLDAAQGIAMSGDPFTAPWEPNRYYNPDYGGVIGYFVSNVGSETKTVTDYQTGLVRTYRGYVIALWDQDGHDPCFITGPKFSGQ